MRQHLKMAATLLAILAARGGQAQVNMSGAYNTGAPTALFGSGVTVTNDANGVGYVAANGAEVYHLESSPSGFIVNGLYNSYNASVSGFTATPSTPGIDYFLGADGNRTSSQTIGGTVAPRFGILELDNGTNEINITNTNGIEVGQLLSFKNGITTTDRALYNTGALKFLAGSTYSNSALGDAQYVNGYVSKTGNTAFTFPVGSPDGTDLRTLSISAPANAADNITVAYYTGDASSSASSGGGAHPRASRDSTLVSVSPVGFWDWIPAPFSGTGSITITVSLPAQTGLGSYALASDIRLVGYSTATGKWEILGTTGASSLSEGATLTGTMSNMSNYNAIGWGSLSQLPLPLRLTDLQAALDAACTARLNWHTEDDGDVAVFNVQYSTDAQNFRTIGSVDARGSENGGDYAFAYNGLTTGNAYFRLEMTGKDQKTTYSKTVKVIADCAGKGQPVISPVPVTTYLQITNPAGTALHIQVYAANGQLVYSRQGTEAVFQLNTQAWAPGNYFVHLAQDGLSLPVRKLTKQ